MATELKSGTGAFMLTRYWGGDRNGVCVQVTDLRGLDEQYVTLTREQAKSLAEDLTKFADDPMSYPSTWETE